MRFGFIGSTAGLTLQQQATLEGLLLDYGPDEFHYLMRRGDEDARRVVDRAGVRLPGGLRLVGHPGPADDPELSAEASADALFGEASLLERLERLARLTDVVVIAWAEAAGDPAADPLARRLALASRYPGQEVLILHPDGEVEDLCRPANHSNQLRAPLPARSRAST